MEQKTKVLAEEGKQELLITREFDLPVELLFKAYSTPELIEQWMGTRLSHFEGKPFGSYQMETRDPKGNVAFRASGVFHTFIENKKIIRTFEMEKVPFGVQLEVYEFHPVSNDTSKLDMKVIYESVAKRDENLKLPFKIGINMAHDRLEEILKKRQ